MTAEARKPLPVGRPLTAEDRAQLAASRDRLLDEAHALASEADEALMRAHRADNGWDERKFALLSLTRAAAALFRESWARGRQADLDRGYRA